MAKTDKKSAQADINTRGDNAADEPRDGNGRFAKASGFRPDARLPDLTVRNAALGALGAGIAVAAVAAGTALFKGWNERSGADDSAGETSARSKRTGLGAGDVIDDDKRDAFAPATLPVPSRVEAMGNGLD